MEPRSDAAGPGRPLSDTEYRRLTEQVLSCIEATVDGWLQDDVIDIDVCRTGGLLEMTFPGGSKIVVNTQPPLQELWLASRSGGYHFGWRDGAWRIASGEGEFFAVLSQQVSRQAGQPLVFQPLG